MRTARVIRRLIEVPALVALAVVNTPITAAADDDPPVCPAGTVPSSPNGGWICIPATSPGNDSGGGDAGSDDVSNIPTAVSCQDSAGASVSCTNADGGVWSAGHQCYAYPLVPQPPADTAYWEGHQPSEGTVWTCDRSLAIPSNTWFVPGAEAPPDPGQMAQTIVKSMPLVKPTVSMAPAPPLMTYVGLPTWLWLGPNQWRNVSASATVGATKVTVVAEPIRVTWDLGDGTQTCTSAGRPWVAGMTSDEETDCSYAFQRVSDFEDDQMFRVTAAIAYAVDWTCSGTCTSAAGTLGEVLGFTSEPIGIQVGERQSVVIR